MHEQPHLWRGSTVLESLMPAGAQPDALDVSFPTRRILAIVGDKWTTVVLYCLSIREHRRFNELHFAPLAEPEVDAVRSVRPGGSD